MSDGSFTEKTRNIIKQRADGRCEMCGMPCPTGQIHHRKPRRAGGTNDPRIGTAANGVYLHASCHTKVESSRTWAVQRGWLLYAVEYPHDVPIRLWHGWVLLSATGQTRQVDSPFDQGPTMDGGSGSASILPMPAIPVDDGVDVHLCDTGYIVDGVAEASVVGASVTVGDDEALPVVT